MDGAAATVGVSELLSVGQIVQTAGLTTSVVDSIETPPPLVAVAVGGRVGAAAAFSSSFCLAIEMIISWVRSSISLAQHHSLSHHSWLLNKCSTGAFAFVTNSSMGKSLFLYMLQPVYFFIQRASICLHFVGSFVFVTILNIGADITLMRCNGSAQKLGSGIISGSLPLSSVDGFCR